MCPNVKFTYLYRDAGNYKVHGFVIFANPDGADLFTLKTTLISKLIDGEFFEPTKCNVPRLFHKDFSFDNALDHAWNEFNSLENTEELPSDARTITEFIRGITV